ncbi:MAG: polyprenyl synthetase family protein [Desulfobacterales bacterium]|uniref:Polyprenyl synthetase family protein n=1 Tax=Candidatus Desulfatibia profunda TaxID=2841695 RepID=A0A8J6TIW2_9BACT|nr:polyprenyl synthetase family protein [Candidatus Desulfatibia profunda]MBL7180293.1 polyprenyl synthetase family protein [Desulfobacterales bacterium]MBL7207983.1 polyprenyl synthetase family protein [Desulfobacterales bacterium]
MNSFDLKAYFVCKRKQINDALVMILNSAENSSRILEAMKYSLMAGGKRIRPILCLAAAEAVGGKPENTIRAACAIEMIHTYSLIHDDLPAIDNDDLRRGLPTCHVAFDEATAILAGDGLLTLAFQILSRNDFKNEKHALKWLGVLHHIASAAGYEGMIEGQMRDIVSEGIQLDIEDLEKIHALKTGALIEASIYTGAVLGGGSHQQIERLRIYAKNIGLAFQVADDILDVEGDPAVMGKGVGTDQSRDKNTYPALIGIKESKAFARKLINNALQALDYFDNKSDPLRAIARYIIERKR